MKTFRRSCVCIIALFLICPPLSAGHFKVLKTDNLALIHANPLHEFLVPHVALCYENAFRYHCAFWDYAPSEPVTVTIFDIGDYGNAGATAIPVNRIAVFMAPVTFIYETAPANERINTMMNHEMVHVVALDKPSGSDRFFRFLFQGKVNEIADNPLTIFYGYFTTPRSSAPRWFHEGIAVFMETWMAGGLGRAQGGFDEMVFRTMVHDSSRFYDAVGLESEAMKTDFQVGILAYLYGTRFFSYLAYEYGPEKLRNWVNRSTGSKAYFSSQFKHVYGLTLDDAWRNWVKWEKEFQRENLDSIAVYPLTGYRDMTSEPLGSLSRGYFDAARRKLYLALNFPGEVAHLAAIDVDRGTIEKITDIKGAAIYYVTSLAYDSVSQTLFYTSDNDEWRDLRAYDLKTGESRMLQEDARIGDLAYNYADSSLWGIKHFNGIVTLVKIPYPYEKWKQIYSWPFGRTLYDIDVSPDGERLVGTLAHVNGHQQLIMMDIPRLMAADTSYTVLHDFGKSNPANFVFTSDGQYLYGSSYYTGVSNVFRYDFARDSMEAVTNCKTGFFRPLPVSDDSLIVYRFTDRGFHPAMIADTSIEDISAIRYLGTEVVTKYPEIGEWIIGSPRAIDLDSMIIDSGDYHALSHMDLVSMYPIVEGYKDHVAYGMRFNVAEPIGFHKSNLTLSYTPNTRLPEDERVHVDWNYDYMEWNLNFKYNGADFYDLFGPTKTSRKGYSLGLNYNHYLIYDGPRRMSYALGLTGYGGLERLPDYQNISASYDKFATFNFRLMYSNQKASLGAVDYEKGYKWQLAVRSTYVRSRYLPLFYGTLDFGLPTPIHHSALWFRNAAGFSTGDRSDPFANFFFGGFGNNWVDYQSEKRYRSYYAFPGVDLNGIAGINFGKAIVEWTLPPLRFRHMGTTSFYLTSSRMALFSTGIITNMDDPAWQRTVGNIGGQIDFRLTLLSHLKLTLSVGYAMAFEKGYSPTDEFMMSVRIL